MTCEVRNKEINSQVAELLVRPLYIIPVKILGTNNFFALHSYVIQRKERKSEYWRVRKNGEKKDNQQ